MSDPGRAWRAGEDPAELSRRIDLAHEEFLCTGQPGPAVRPLVAQSWRRCVSEGMDPEHSLAPVDLLDDALELWRQGHPLADAMPVVRNLLGQDAVDSGLLVAVSDAAGRLLWVEGDSAMRTRAASMHFVEGACWSEAAAGTNAPGTALALDRPVQIFAAEHLSRVATAWSCSAAPIHDPHTGAVIGALDLTGGDAVAAPHSLALVRATVAAIEAHLRLHPGRSAPESGTLSLEALGRGVGVLLHPGGVTRLSLSHSELLVLLAHAPQGLDGDSLAVGLRERDLASVTLRAELSRLRRLVAPLGLDSRPYRLSGPLHTDAHAVRECLRRGDVAAAVARYRGPLLPKSQAPGVVTLREELHEHLRAALLRAGDAQALLAFAGAEHGRLDWQIWRAAEQAVPAASPQAAAVTGHLAWLAREIGHRPDRAALLPT